MSTFAVSANNARMSYTDIECAGAIHKLEWPLDASPLNFINFGDDGRELQSSCSLDHQEEGYNPTEGGSLHTPAFSTPSDSKLVMHARGSNTVETVTRMSLWKTGQLSNFWLHKKLTLGANRIDAHIEFHTPANEPHTQLQMEIWTGYMPWSFSRIFALDRQEGAVRSLSDGGAVYAGDGTLMGYGEEQILPVILSYTDGSRAMGAIVPAWGDAAPGPMCGYGRWRFTKDQVMKWNAVARVDNPAMPGVYAYDAVAGFGDLKDTVNVLSATRGLYASQVRRLYWATLQRAPDAGGYQYYIDQRAAGTSLVSIASGFVSSAEFQGLYGNTTDTQFVTLLYHNVLGRDPTQSEVDYHVNELKTISRAQLVVNFSESPEYQIKRLLLEA